MSHLGRVYRVVETDERGLCVLDVSAEARDADLTISGNLGKIILPHQPFE